MSNSPVPVEVNNSADNFTIEKHLSVVAKEKLGAMDLKCVSRSEANPGLTISQPQNYLTIALVRACYEGYRRVQ